MSKSKGKKPTLGDPGDDAPEPDRRSALERAAEEQEEKIVELLKSEQVAGGLVILRRRAFNETEFGHLAEMPVENFSQENVKKIYGGGDYKCQVKSGTGKFLTWIAFKVDYRIPALYPGVSDRPRDDRPADRTPEIIAAIKDALPRAPAQDNTMQLEMFKTMGAMMTAAMARPAPGPDPMIAELRAELRELRAARSGGGDNFLKEIEKFRTLSEMFGGGGDGPAPAPDRVTELIKALAPAVAPFVQRLLTGGAQVEPAAAPAAQPAITAGAAAAPGAQPENSDPMQNPIFTAYIAQFRALAVLAASKGRNAFEWADSQLDAIDPKYHEAIFKLANGDDWFSKIFGGDAAATAHFTWLLDMRNAILTRAFVGDVRAAYAATPRPEPDAYAKLFLDRVSVSYHDALWDLLDPDAWKETFRGVTDLDAVWLEKLRVAFEKELGDDEAPPESAATGAAPVEPAATTAPEAVARAAAAPAAKPPRRPAAEKKTAR